ncbi:MAG: folylpolyglutamate synthase/dihydrofolate synthase family protein [Flammeovirgaceae bacterium]
MNYAETLQYLYNRLPMFQRIGKAAYKADLNNTIALCEHLGNPQRRFRSIHIAGTNGKGSSSHFIASTLQSAGYKVGLYTSPHLKSFTERIRLNGKEIPEKEVVDFVEKNRGFIEEISPSFFELTVAMAFEYFAKEKVDFAVIEVGLGGRLDSTNVIHPVLSLITNISYDHQDLLGDTLPKIAFEKAGIIKPSVPVVISQRQKEVEEVFIQKAALEKAPIFFASERFRATRNPKTGTIDLFEDEKCILPNLELDLKGQYQTLNIVGVAQALKILQQQENLSITLEHWRKGIENASKLTGLKGRWQKIHDQPRIICDIGHNEDGIRQVLESLAFEHNRKPYKQLHWVFGAVNDKDLSKVLKLLPKNAQYYFCQASIPRALDVNILAEQAKSFGLNGSIVKDVNKALQTAKQIAEKEDFILVGGSTFVVAEVEEI